MRPRPDRLAILLILALTATACGDSTILTGPDAEAAAERFQAELQAEAEAESDAEPDRDVPIIILDGEPLSDSPRKLLRTIEPKDIERIEVHKSCYAVSLLGEEPENGIILIYTKSFEGERLKLEVRYPELREACVREFQRRRSAERARSHSER